MKYLLPVVLLLPVIAHAQQPRNFNELVNIFLSIINNALIPAVFTLTFFVIIWGIVKTWIMSPGDEAEREKGKQLVFAGIIALVIMSGIWGIVALLRFGFFGS